jgi:Type II secretion system (T2SS), protein E, N-terminal domain
LNAVGVRPLPADDLSPMRKIRVSEPGRLRDYFLRLGAKAEILEDGLVSVELADHDSSIEDYFQNWSSVNGCPGVVEQAVSPLAPVTESVAAERPRLGELLVDRNLITVDQLAEAVVESRLTGVLLGRVLLQHQWLFEDELARTLATQLGLPYINIRVTGVDRSIAKMMPAETGVRVGAIPIGFYGGRVRVAFADPCDDQAQDAVKRHVSNADVVIAELSDIESAWRTVAHVNTGAGVWSS